MTSIRIPVDPANPGQFFACCGLLELASRIAPDAEGWFRDNIFFISGKLTLKDLLATARSISLEKDDHEANDNLDESDEDTDDTEDDDDGPISPLMIISPVTLRLDWWSEKSLKTWAGSMKERLIFIAMCGAIDADNCDPLNQRLVIYDPTVVPPGMQAKLRTSKKREPFYFDSEREANARSIDIGFIPDKLKMFTLACPTIEAMCLIGLQRCRPKTTLAPREFDYFTWSNPYSVTLLPAAVTGILQDKDTRRYRFTNEFRSDQRKHKAFQQATLQPKHHEQHKPVR